MTTTPHDVTPLPCASFVDDWQPGPPPYRYVLGPQRRIGEVEVQTSVAQFADGAIDRVGLIEPPKVHVRASSRPASPLRSVETRTRAMRFRRPDAP